MQRVEYTVNELQNFLHPENPKDHDIGFIITSIVNYGFVGTVERNLLTGYLVRGHGRVRALKQMQDKGYKLPDGVTLNDSGAWCLEIIEDDYFNPGTHKKFLIADNRATELGGWLRGLDSGLDGMLKEFVQSGDIDAIGYDMEDIEVMVTEAETGLVDNWEHDTKICKCCGRAL